MKITINEYIAWWQLINIDVHPYLFDYLQNSNKITYEWIKENIVFLLYSNDGHPYIPNGMVYVRLNPNLDPKIIDEIVNQYKDLL
jgi:hypothetical protein